MTDLPPCPELLEPYARALIAEECAETIQAKEKGNRFGYHHANRTSQTAHVMMSTEVGDVLAAIAFGRRAGVLDMEIVHQQAARKFARLIDPASTDDEGRRLAPDLPAEQSDWTLLEQLTSWPAAPEGTDALSATFIGNLLTDALGVIWRQRETLNQAAQQFRSYEREHREKGDATMRTFEVESMKKAGAAASYAKADRNGAFAALCEERHDAR